MTQRPGYDVPDRMSLDGDHWWTRPFLGGQWIQHRAHLPGPIDSERWWPARVPGSAVTDALAAGAIPDPYRGLNSRAAEWLADRALGYRTEFGREPLRPGERATPFIRMRDGRPVDAPGWMVTEDSGFHLMPGKTTRLTVGWSGAPPSPRRILLDGFNVPTTMLPGGSPTS